VADDTPTGIWYSLETLEKPRDPMTDSKFFAGNRVRISEQFFWAKGATGTISEPPGAVVAISGPWDGNLTRQEESRLGAKTVYWVWFDEAQFDADGEGPYSGGQIWEDALTILEISVN